MLCIGDEYKTDMHDGYFTHYLLCPTKRYCKIFN